MNLAGTELAELDYLVESDIAAEVVEPATRLDPGHPRKIPVDRRPPWVVVASIFFGLGWLRAAAEKSMEQAWWTGEIIETFVAENSASTLGWFQPILDYVLSVPMPIIAANIFMAQILIGVCLLLNHHSGVALMVGTSLNVGFVAIGAVNPSAFYLLGQGVLLLWMVGEHRRLHPAMRWVAVAAALFAAMNLPYISTLDPAQVVDDPAAMLITLGGLTSVGAYLTYRWSVDATKKVELNDVDL